MTTDAQRAPGIDVESLVILAILLASGLVPVVWGLATDAPRELDTDLGWAVSIAALCGIAHQLASELRHRRKEDHR